jgi:hypothetical protein
LGPLWSNITLLARVLPAVLTWPERRILVRGRKVALRSLVSEPPVQFAQTDAPEPWIVVGQPGHDRLLSVALLLDEHARPARELVLAVDAGGAIGGHAAHEPRRMRVQDALERRAGLDAHIGRSRRGKLGNRHHPDQQCRR